jgi:hypothetical protein
MGLLRCFGVLCSHHVPNVFPQGLQCFPMVFLINVFSKFSYVFLNLFPIVPYFIPCLLSKSVPLCPLLFLCLGLLFRQLLSSLTLFGFFWLGLVVWCCWAVVLWWCGCSWLFEFNLIGLFSPPPLWGFLQECTLVTYIARSKEGFREIPTLLTWMFIARVLFGFRANKRGRPITQKKNFGRTSQLINTN